METSGCLSRTEHIEQVLAFSSTEVTNMLPLVVQKERLFKVFP